MKYRISDVACINNESVNKRNYKGIVNYVDTSSVVNGIFEGYQCFSNIFEAPSRARRLVSVGDTIISTVRPNMRHVGFISKQNDYIYSTGFAIVSPKKDKIDPYYLYLFLSSNRVTEILQSIGETSTSTYPSVKPSDIANLVIDIPSLIEQRTIAKRIRWIDEKKGVNNQINANLLDFSQTFFKKKFGIEGKIPLSNYFLPKRGKNLLKKNVIKGSVPVVAGGLKPAAYHNSANTEAPVITISASGANAGYVQIWGEKVWSSDSSYIDSSLSKNIYFWFLFLKSKQKQIFDSQTGSAQPHIYPKHIGNILVPKLHENEIQNFNKTLTPFFEKIFQNEKENMTLQNVKTGLLNQYFS
ncbi:MAG: restriction endonuclease subunit S [Lactobacillaceae bacterium]